MFGKRRMKAAHDPSQHRSSICLLRRDRKLVDIHGGNLSHIVFFGGPAALSLASCEEVRKGDFSPALSELVLGPGCSSCTAGFSDDMVVVGEMHSLNANGSHRVSVSLIDCPRQPQNREGPNSNCLDHHLHARFRRLQARRVRNSVYALSSTASYRDTSPCLSAQPFAGSPLGRWPSSSGGTSGQGRKQVV